METAIPVAILKTTYFLVLTAPMLVITSSVLVLARTYDFSRSVLLASISQHWDPASKVWIKHLRVL